MDYRPAAVAVGAAASIAITTHLDPDGDGVGAALALARVLRQAGKAPRLLVPSRVHGLYSFLPGFDQIAVVEDPLAAKQLPPVELLISLDCGDRARLGAVVALPHQCLLNIDHHAAGSAFGDLALIDGEIACTCQMVAELIDALGLPIDVETAACLYTGLVFDTGRFMHGNTGSREFAFAARLAATGLDVGAINRRLTYSRSRHDLQVQELALRHLHLDAADPRLAGIALPLAAIRAVGEPEDWGELVDLPRSLAGVEVAYLLRERGDGSVRCSLRSNPPYAVGPVAQAHGGGGHQQAAGCTIAGDLASVHERLRDDLRASLGSESRNTGA